jgi:hypothetical protein
MASIALASTIFAASALSAARLVATWRRQVGRRTWHPDAV